MKKIATLFAVGVVALGASAQATEVPSDEYAVITIPLSAGDNLVGVSVSTNNAAATSMLTNLDPGAVIDFFDGSGYSSKAVPVNTGDAFFVNAGKEASTVYQLGVAPTATDMGGTSTTVTFSGTMALVSSPFAAEWSLGDITISPAGGNTISKANKIHIWNGSGYDTFFLRNNRWFSKKSGVSVPDSIGAGRGVVVELGNPGLETEGTITFAAPQ